MRKLFFILLLLLIGFGWQSSSPKLACAQTGASCCDTGYVFSNLRCVKQSALDSINSTCQNFPNYLSLIPGVQWSDIDGIKTTCVNTFISSFTSVTQGASIIDYFCTNFVDYVYKNMGQNPPGPNDPSVVPFITVCKTAVNVTAGLLTAGNNQPPDKCPAETTCNLSTGTCSGGFGTKICSFISSNENDPARQSCETCFNLPGVFTPFGCIEATPQLFISKILRIAIGISGGIAFLMIVYGGFVTMTSAGNPEQLTNGKEIITSAIAGLLMIIFSVVILKIIGVDILGLPGFGG